MELTEKTILVTGGSSGIGRAIALEAAENGATVVNADLQREARADVTPTDEEIRERGGDATFVETDVTDIEDVRTAVDAAVGGLDVMVNNAGIGESYALTETSQENWQTVLETNLTGVYNGCLAAVQRMTDAGGEGGAIVNIASGAGVVGLVNTCSYSAAKGGVISLTRQIAVDYAGEGLRVNAISPGFVATPLLREDTHSGTADYAMERTPLRRLGDPGEIATAVVFLASDAASFITGQNLPVDGGYTTV